MKKGKCSYCNSKDAFIPPYAKKTFVCIDCLYNSKKFNKDFLAAMKKKNIILGVKYK